MPGRRTYGDLPTLPPMDYWQTSTLQYQSIETPLDERGFVDMDAVVEVASSYIDPEYQWESPFNDVHHLQWSISTMLPVTASEHDRQIVGEFRELVNRKMYTSRVFHDWVHWLMAAPSIPDVEAMKHSIDAQRVALSLARVAHLATRLTRIKSIPERKLTQRLDQEFINYNLYMENARLVPLEYRVLKLEEVEVEKPEDLLTVNKHLGRLAISRVPVRMRKLRARAVAWR